MFKSSIYLVSTLSSRSKIIRFKCLFTKNLSTPSLSSIHRNLRPLPLSNCYTFDVLLKSYIRTGDLRAGKSAHCEIIKKGNCLDLIGWNILLNLYTVCDALCEAVNVFDEMPNRNTVSFVTLIQGCARSSSFTQCGELFRRMRIEGHEINAFVFTTILKLVLDMDQAMLCCSIHAYVDKLGHDSNLYVTTSLIHAYSVSGFADRSRQIFDATYCKDIILWTTMIDCYTENACFEEALTLFLNMRKHGFSANTYTLATALGSCIAMEAYDLAKCIHACVLKLCFGVDIHVGLGLLHLYSGVGDMNDAVQVFYEMPRNDVVSWSFLIARHAQNNQSETALVLFSQMLQASVIPNDFTFTSVLQACSDEMDLRLGEQIHCHVIKAGMCEILFITNPLIDVYTKSGELDDSMKLFMESPYKNIVTWNTLIVGCVNLGDEVKALVLFKDMLGCHLHPTEVTYSSALKACSTLAAVVPGTEIHSMSIKSSYDMNVTVYNALIDMYAKCGYIINARLIFDSFHERDHASWNSIIMGYSMFGLRYEATRLFEMMLQNGFKPNKVSFVAVLSACSNGGLLAEGEAYFRSMIQDHGIEPSLEHCTCMVWLLGRLGHLHRAVRLIKECQFLDSILLWNTLLAACVIHNDVKIATLCASHTLKLDPCNKTTHLLLAKLYSASRRWEDFDSVKKSLEKHGMKRDIGLSWIEHQNTVQSFSAGDTSHPDMKLIRSMLVWLHMQITKVGYVPDFDSYFHDIEDKMTDRKEVRLWMHSERLALAFGLVRMPFKKHIWIIKNLRICADCHTVMKLVSKIIEKDITIRDMNRFHHFHSGNCSCHDYW